VKENQVWERMKAKWKGLHCLLQVRTVLCTIAAVESCVAFQVQMWNRNMETTLRN